MKILHYLKRFILFVIKEVLSFFIKLFLFLFIVGIIISAVIKNFEKKPTVAIKDKAYILINLADSYNERLLKSNLFEDDSISFYTLLQSVENASYDDRVEGIILKMNGDSLSYAQSEELAHELSMARAADKKIIAYFENVGRKNYYLASYANEIYMPSANSTNVNIYPYFREEFYIKKLADKFGVKFNIIHVGDYKSYMENLASSTMSKEAREDTVRILDKNYNNFLDIVSLNRKLNRDDLDKIIKDGDLVAASSVDLMNNKLIDKYAYWDNIISMVGGKDKIITIQDYTKNYYKEENLESSNNVVYVIPLEGDIVESETEVFAGEENINVAETLEKLNIAKENNKIKAVVLRINSPGGSALTSDIIAEKIKELASEKPVYVSMSSVAASGGYYISANADKIFVDRNTITGSIGVVSILPDFSKLITDNGVNIEKISEGEYSDLYSSDTFTEKKYNKIYNSNLKVYDDFLNVVSKARKIDKEKLKTIAEGRIWTGEEAVKIGLADEIGGLNEAIYGIAEDNDMDEYSIVVAKDKFELGNIYRKYSRYIKMDTKDLIKEKIFKDYLYNKPVTYLPYDVLD
ncbi:signal peptide peptidase SppA, 67K type [Fusobacterium animalis 7_1]|uniref:Signal peptide peptidase SppA, 67K type n=1 Tax=Fusobacterium animalis 7_1 TaxID=457405 RepID=A0A140PPL6_9FUSO|nr:MULTISPECIES: signal peptide peptidase SppA [Fusobacterium]EEO41634.1 signal peptide peptidase SppA, 67K type [Fusobacterium animalis 7_1]EGN64598.1 signal peptide peptidase SppA, 67K type [Fusobacterium animalis 21_1A]EHG20282.2 signal peptide peptidase SppA, 67K type [Fusobacterium polymorphum F0401]MCL4582605.1 protease [Fusobacterium nucleatum YWH7054]MCL4592655.1 protease [Fusobacterium nucleatum YWH7053]